MGEVIVRQWGPNCYAAYVAGNGAYPDFVGIESSRADAEIMAESRCAPGVCGGASDAPLGELKDPVGPPPGRTPIHPVHAGRGASDDCTYSERDLPAATRKEVQWP